MIDPIHAFYCSKKYIELSALIKLQSGGICAHCGGVFDIATLRTHHVIELTLDNIHDPKITLSADNIIVLCHDCHNKVHHRFSAARIRHVYVVWGAPCSGKTTYVRQVATRYDLVIDLDRLHEAICVCDMYDKPNATKEESFALRDLLLERVRYRAGKWEDSYIIGCYPDRTRREQLERDYGAELVHIDTPHDECIARAIKDNDRVAVRTAYMEIGRAHV